MKLLFFGSGAFAVPTLADLSAGPHEVALVVTQPDRPRGRGRMPAPTPVKTYALEHRLPVVSFENVNAADATAELLAVGPELGVVIAYGQKIGPALLDAVPGGMINLHASLLPRHRGAAPVNRAILAGDTTTGVTVFRLCERMDAGPVLAKRELTIDPAETASELHDRLAALGPETVRAALDCFSTTLDPPGNPQDESLATPAGKLSKADARLDFNQPAEMIRHQVHGLWSWPGATCRFRAADGKRDEAVTLARVAVVDEAATEPAGTIRSDLTLATGGGALRVVELKPSGGRLMDWSAYVNGRHVRPGDRMISMDA